MAERVGFIGLGLMGKSMASNLLAAGYELTVHNRSRGAVDELVSEGAHAAEGPEEVAAASDVVITMLPDSPDVEKVVAGEGGVLAGLRRGALIVDMSTISAGVTERLAGMAREREIGYVDAPVSGGDAGARDGTLSIMAGGAAEDFARARPLFEVMGETIVHVGEAGTGQVVKSCNQIVVGLTIGAVSEALVLGSKAGVSPEKILEVLGGGLAGNKLMEAKREKLLSHEFPPGFRAELHHKDLGIALDAGREYGVPLPGTAIMDQLFGVMEQRGLGSEDHSALIKVIEELAGHTTGESGAGENE